MIKLSKSNVSHILLFTIAAGVFLSNPIDVNTPTEVQASTLSFVITQFNFPSLNTSTKTTNEVIGSITVSGVQIDLGVKNATKTNGTLFENGEINTPGSINMTRDASVLYNINPLPGTINQIIISQSTGVANTIYIGNSSRIINSIQANYTPISGTVIGQKSEGKQEQTFNSSNFPEISNQNVSYFAFFAEGNNQISSITFEMTVQSIVITSGETYSFAVDFLAATQNKAGLCTDAGLKWSFASIDPSNPETAETNNPDTLEGQYSKLTGTQKTAFKTDTTDSQIVAARQRYIYLRSFNPLLTNFAEI